MAEVKLDPSKAGLRAQIVAELNKNEATAKAQAKAGPGEEEAEPDESEGTDIGEPDAEEGEGPEEPEEAEEPEAEPAEKGEEPAAAKEGAPPEKVSKGLAALAERDAASRKEHQARMAELKDYEQRLVAGRDQMREQLATEIKAQMRREAIENPIGFYKSIGVSKGYKDLGAQFYYAELGAEAPPEVREKAHLYGLQQKVADVDQRLNDGFKQLREERSKFENERRIADYRSGLLADLPKVKNAPYLAALAADDRNGAADALIAAASEYVRAHPNEPPPTAAILAVEVEKVLQQRLKPWKGMLGKTPSPAADAEDEPAQTLSANHSGRTPTKKAPQSRDEKRKDILRELRRRQARPPS